MRPAVRLLLIASVLIANDILMPRNLVRPLPLRPREVEMFRAWITAGAPGPL